MVTKEGCVAGQTPPDLEKGDTVGEGFFLRNLKKKGEATKRYPGDDDDNPVFGFKLAPKFWKNASRNGDMSINEQTCVGSEACSIAIHRNATDYYHVAILDLAEVNRCMQDHTFVAQYAPINDPPDGPNACHFELLPLDGSTQSLFALQTFLDDPFPPGKMPDGEKNRASAANAADAYRKVLLIRRWVRDEGGALE